MINQKQPIKNNWA